MALPYLNYLPDPQQAAFESAVRALCGRLNIKPEWLMVIMYKESKVSPTRVNKDSQATGLIQFTPDTATGLGTSVSALKKLSAINQLPWVEKYYRNQIASTGIKPKALIDLYMLTLYPAAAGRPDSYVVFNSQSASSYNRKVYSQNSGLDYGKKGYVTIGDIRKWIESAMPAEWSTAASAGILVGGLVLAAGMAFIAYETFNQKK